MLADDDCTATGGTAGYDLLHITVDLIASRYRLTARYAGDAQQHDIVVSFGFPPSTATVVAELFEDGNGTARVFNATTSEDVFLDPPQTVAPGLVDLTVRSDLLGGLGSGPIGVGASLQVDGQQIETCP